MYMHLNHTGQVSSLDHKLWWTHSSSVVFAEESTRFCASLCTMYVCHYSFKKNKSLVNCNLCVMFTFLTWVFSKSPLKWTCEILDRGDGSRPRYWAVYAMMPRCSWSSFSISSAVSRGSIPSSRPLSKAASKQWKQDIFTPCDNNVWW